MNFAVRLVRRLIYVPKRVLYYLVMGAGAPIFLMAAFLCALIVRVRDRHGGRKPKLVFGPAPIISNGTWPAALRQAGWEAVGYTENYARTINRREDYDLVLEERYPFVRKPVARLLAFLECLFKYDIFVTSFYGWFLGDTIFWRFEAPLLHLARKRIIIIPFGGDVYVYRRVRSTTLMHGLMLSMPWAARQQKERAQKVDYWCEHADIVIPDFRGMDGVGRWDVLTFCCFVLDLERWQPSIRQNDADGTNGTVVISHAPNFRGFKGTEFLVRAVKVLQDEGLLVELNLVEGVLNPEVQRVLEEDTDILVEQLIATGHGLNALEGMASGLPVVCNLDDDTYVLPFRRWSYFEECPLVSATPENVEDVLRELVTRPQLRRQLATAGRAFVEKYNGYDSAQFLFEQIIEKFSNAEVDLLNIYHPFLGEYPKRMARIQHPLVKNRIVSAGDTQ